MSKITIFHINGTEIFSHECEGNTIAITAEEAVKQGVSLSGADLTDAKLSGANLSGAYLSRADLSDANLYRANLSAANLSRANLSGADLTDANLSGAKLSGADLSGAKLSDANLSGAIIENETLTKNPITKSLKWFVLITEKYMRIGCQRHTHSEWEKFSEEEISKMATGASEFWKEHKEELIGLCKVHAQS